MVKLIQMKIKMMYFSTFDHQVNNNQTLFNDFITKIYMKQNENFAALIFLLLIYDIIVNHRKYHKKITKVYLAS